MTDDSGDGARADDSGDGVRTDDSGDGVRTEIDAARDRVAAERERTRRKLSALDEFRDRVRGLEPTDPSGMRGGSGGGATGGGGGATGGTPGLSPTTGGAPGAAGAGTPGAGGTDVDTGSSGGGCRAVRRAFADCLGDTAGDPGDSHETVHEAIAAELSDEVAVALAAADGGGRLTPQLQQGVLAETKRRRSELSVMDSALRREAESLAAATEPVATTVDWLREHDPTPLSELSFDTLADWHRTLAAFRDRLDGAAATRQAFLDETTGENGTVGIRHADLVAYLYGDDDGDDNHPVLVTLGRLDETCGEAQRALRAHLVCRA